MSSRLNERNLSGLAILVFLLILPEFATAASPCLNTTPSFNIPIIASSGQSTLEVSIQAGCYWEVVSHSKWIKILSLNRGYGSGSIVFQAVVNEADARAPGFMRFAVHDLNQRHVTTLSVVIGAAHVRNNSAAVDCSGRMENAGGCASNGR